ncbi:MAG: hypothetical protein ACKO5C_06435 [Ferruginibacter sp.]
MKKGVLFSLGYGLALVSISAQVPESVEPDKLLLPAMETAIVLTNEEVADFEDSEWADALRKDKIDLNAPEAVQKLAMFPFVHQAALLQFVLYRDACGPFLHPVELQAVPGWTATMVRTLLPYLIVKRIPESVSVGKRMWQLSRFQADIQCEIATRSYETSRTFRDIASIRKRYIFKSPLGLKTGIVLEKDRGEPFLTNRNGLPDHIGYFLERTSNSFVETLIVGDFRVQLGIGLLKNQNNSGYRSLFRQFTASTNPFVKPHQSFHEWQYERGVALQCQQGHWKAGMYFSAKRMDARLSADSSPIVLSWNRTGLHRDSSEVQQKDQVAITEWGGHIRFQQKRVALGVHGLFNQWRHPFSLADNNMVGNRLRRVREQTGIGFSASISLHNLFLTAEYAYRSQIGSAVAAGVLLSLGRHADMSVDVSIAAKKFCHYNHQVHEPLVFANQSLFVKTVFRYQSSSRTEFNVYTLWTENPLSPVLPVRQEVGLQTRIKFKADDPILDLSWIGSFRLAGQAIALQQHVNESKQQKVIIKLSGPPKRKNDWSLGIISQIQRSHFSTGGSSLAFLGNTSAEIAGIRMKLGAIIFYTDNYQSRIYFPIVGFNNSKTVEYVYGKGILLQASYDWKPRKWLAISMQIRHKWFIEPERSNQQFRCTVALRFLRDGME